MALSSRVPPSCQVPPLPPLSSVWARAAAAVAAFHSCGVAVCRPATCCTRAQPSGGARDPDAPREPVQRANAIVGLAIDVVDLPSVAMHALLNSWPVRCKSSFWHLCFPAHTTTLHPAGCAAPCGPRGASTEAAAGGRRHRPAVPLPRPDRVQSQDAAAQGQLARAWMNSCMPGLPGQHCTCGGM